MKDEELISCLVLAALILGAIASMWGCHEVQKTNRCAMEHGYVIHPTHQEYWTKP